MILLKVIALFPLTDISNILLFKLDMQMVKVCPSFDAQEKLSLKITPLTMNAIMIH